MDTSQNPQLLFANLARKIEASNVPLRRLAELKTLETIWQSLSVGSNGGVGSKVDATGQRSRRRKGSVSRAVVVVPEMSNWTIGAFLVGWRWYAAITTVIVTVVVMIAVLATVFIRWEMYTSRGLASAWISWTDRDLYEERCAVDMPRLAQDVFRPPVDCSTCQGVTQVDRVAEISIEEFSQRYAYSGRPLVVTDGAANWSALQHFSFDFFKTLYGRDSPNLSNYRKACQFFPYKTEFRSLNHFFGMNEQRARLEDGSQPWYVGWSNCDSSAANVLRKLYSRPYFLPTDAESSKTDWIFMGSPGYGAHMHIDHVGNPSWQAQIVGNKKWILEPSSECAHVCHGIDVIVRPGEIIIIDTNIWFHQTQIVGDELSITIGSEYD